MGRVTMTSTYHGIRTDFPAHIAYKNGDVVDIVSKYQFGHSHSQLQLQIYLEKMVLTKQTCVLLSGRACVEPTAVARFVTTEYEISG